MPKAPRNKTTTVTTIVNKNKAKSKQRPRSAPNRSSKLIKGKGSYTIAALGAKLAQMARDNIPKGSFERIGSSLGGAAGRGLASFTGVGDYVFNDIIHTPALPTRNQSNLWRISNCEYITDLKTSGNGSFNLYQFALNPGDPSTFPWLSRIARLYQKFKFEQLIFEFRSNTSDYAASGPLGSVIFAPVYNVLADIPQSKQQLEAYSHAISTKPSNSLMAGVECDPREDNIKWYYVRSPVATPTQFTDPGIMFYATNGLPSTTVVGMGEIWVHYTVKFDEPILTTSQAQQAYTRVKVTSNASGLPAKWLAGVSAVGDTTSGVSAPDDKIPDTVAQFKPLTINAGVPNYPYFASLDNSAPVNTSRYWFSAAGTYLITYTANLSTKFTAIAAEGPAFKTEFFSAPPGSTITTNGTGQECVALKSSQLDSYSGSVTLVSTGPNCAVDFTLATTYTGTPVIDSTFGAWLRITRI